MQKIKIKNCKKLAILLIIFSILITPITVNLCSPVEASDDDNQAYYLTVNVYPLNCGTVEKKPDFPSYSPGTVVILNAISNPLSSFPGYTFHHWGGDVNGAIIEDTESTMDDHKPIRHTIEITMDSNKIITAFYVQNDDGPSREPVADFTFSPTSPITNEIIIFDASNSYDLDGGNIFEYRWSYCVEQFGPDDSVSSRDDPIHMGFGQILQFSWNAANTYHVMLTVKDGDENYNTQVKRVIVTGTSDVYYNLDLAISPSEGGIVELNPSGSQYLAGTEVTLHAIPNEGFYFDHWGGDVSGSSSSIEIVMDSDKGAIAFFTDEVEGKYRLSVDIYPFNGGSVVLDPYGGVYDPGTSVNVSASANSGFRFDHWEGDVSGSSLSITVVMDSSKSIRAVFEEVNSQYLQVSVISPQYNYLYVLGREIPLNLTNTIVPIIIGPVSVEVVIENAVGEVTLELYVDDGDEPNASVTTLESMVSLVWDEKAFLRHTITIVATDEADGYSEDYRDVFVINM